MFHCILLCFWNFWFGFVFLVLDRCICGSGALLVAVFSEFKCISLNFVFMDRQFLDCWRGPHTDGPVGPRR